MGFRKGNRLADLEDVSDDAPAPSEVLTRIGSLWEPEPPGAGHGQLHALDSAADHSGTITAAQHGTPAGDLHPTYATDADLTTHAGAADPHTGYRLESALIGTPDIADDAVTLAKLLNIATARFLGRTTAGAGDPEELTTAQATAMLDVFTSALKGLAPASGGGATNFLRADGTWAVPAGGGGPTKIAGASGAAGPDDTWQVLTANSADETAGGTLIVMTTTGVDPGRYQFDYNVLWQSSLATNGIGFIVNHTGTVTKAVMRRRDGTTGTTAATGVSDMVAATLTGQLQEHWSRRVINVVLGLNTGVDTINADLLSMISGILIVSVTGSLTLGITTETSPNAVRAIEGTSLVLRKLS